MRRWFGSCVALSLGISTSAWAGSPPEVIATSGNKPVAQLGSPVAAAPNSAVTPVVYRAQKEEIKAPTGPGINTDSGVPLTSPGMPSPTISMPTAVHGPLTGPMAVHPSLPCTNCAPTPFDPSQAPLPGGGFGMPTGACQPRFYASGEYLLWWIREGGLPALVTTGPAADPLAGFLGNPTTEILYGNSGIDTQGRNGGRFDTGYWFGNSNQWAIEVGGLFLGQRTSTFHADTSTVATGVIARPYFEVNRGINTVEYVSLPNNFTGSIDINTTNNFYGANIDWRRKLWCGACSNWRVDAQVGYRYLHFDEDLVINENLTLASTVPTTTAFFNAYGVRPGSVFTIQDSFRVKNEFNGVMLGLVSNLQRGRWNVDLLTRVSLGNTRQELTIDGNQAVILPSRDVLNFQGGLLARPGALGNIGTYTSDKFSVVPELGLNLGYQFTQHWKVMVGYSFMYWDNILRVGDQIDTRVNVTGIPFTPIIGQTPAGVTGTIPASTVPAPIATLKETDFWAQGVSLGFQFTW